MLRIVGIDIPNEKKTYIALTYIQGIGQTTSEKMLKELNIDGQKRSKELTEDEVKSIAEYIDSHIIVEGQLRRMVSQNIERLRKIRCYRGIRHRQGLPVRGQRTRSNARTRKGPKKTVAGKRSVKGAK